MNADDRLPVTAAGAEGIPTASTPLFAQRNFAALWWGQLISMLGDRFTYLALLGLLASHTGQFREDRSSLLLSLLANVMLAPVLLFAPFTGAWLDRVNLRRVLLISDFMRAVVVVLIPITYQATQHTGPVFILVFLLFFCNVFFLPAKSAMTPEIVPTHQLMAANALLSGAGIAATGAGMLAGGWVVDHWGWTTALWIDAVTYLISVGTLALIRYHPVERPAMVQRITVRSYLVEVGEGWALLTRSATVRLGMLALGAVWLGGSFLHVAGNQHIQRAASVPGMERVGVLMCVLAIGSGVGTWWMNAHGRRLRPALLLGIGLVLAGVGVGAVAVSTRFAVFALAGFMIGLSIAPVFVLSETLLQLGVELSQRGRVFSARDFLMRLLFMVGVALAGAVTRQSDTRAALLAAASLIAAIGLITMATGRNVSVALAQAPPTNEPRPR
ncbi:MAG: MFS transporter [Candidatus Eisenbacteria bacterium]|uniref:MFS transporter n=1 Tax=Eiseniibacteriota bacterium TaxID=2212470 RepID=A0A849SJW3_UNCEI|nr:MFS transporter [Candidatus Eisenbacteria bacterium]